MDELKKLKNRVAQWERDTDGMFYPITCDELYALISAAKRERELVEALRPFAGVAALLDDGLTYSICTEDGAVIVEDDDFRNAARVV
jgi:hypothetical protein